MKPVMSKIGSGVKAGGSNTRLNSQVGARDGATSPSIGSTKGQMIVAKPRVEWTAEEMLTLSGMADRRNDRADICEGGLEAHIDWLQFTGDVPTGTQYQLFEQVEELTGEKLHLRIGKPTQIGVEYQNQGRSLNSVRVAWDNDKEGRNRLIVSIPGKVLSAMPMLKVRELSLLMVCKDLTATRFDGTIDDFRKRLSFKNIVGALVNKNYGGFKTWDFYYSKGGGVSLRLGSRESARSSIIYDKEVESKGRIKSIRVETKFGSKVAHQVLLKWLQIDPDELGENWEEESARFLMSSVCGSFEFIDRVAKPDEKNLNRIPKLVWWKEFVILAGGEIRHKAPIAEPSLERAARWHGRQVFRSLFCVLAALESDAYAWMLNQMETAAGTLNQRHMKQIEQYRLEWNRYKNWNPELALA